MLIFFFRFNEIFCWRFILFLLLWLIESNNKNLKVLDFCCYIDLNLKNLNISISDIRRSFLLHPVLILSAQKIMSANWQLETEFGHSVEMKKKKNYGIGQHYFGSTLMVAKKSVKCVTQAQSLSTTQHSCNWNDKLTFFVTASINFTRVSRVILMFEKLNAKPRIQDFPMLNY